MDMYLWHTLLRSELCAVTNVKLAAGFQIVGCLLVQLGGFAVSNVNTFSIEKKQQKKNL